MTQRPAMDGTAGLRVVLAAAGLAFGDALARGLGQQGAEVARLGGAGASRAGWQAGLDAAVRDLGGLDLVVHGTALPASQPADLDALSLADWQQATSGALFATLCCLQAALPHLRERGGTIVVVGPSAALVGAPGLVPWVTLAEAQRTLVKSAARQWGVHGIRLHWLGLAAAVYGDALRHARMPSVPELGPPPPALGRVPDARADAAAWLALLAGRGAASLTGATLNLDGGDWMVP
jgi:NAD(P)-dependent dehydrogenase (short-subunit alcohol dehydrogenase family)